MASGNNFKETETQDLKYFYTEWEKYARQILSPDVAVKSNFELFNNDQFKKFMSASPIITFVINHTNSCYEFFSDNSLPITGYSSKEFIEGGVAFGMSISDEEQTGYIGNFLIASVFEWIEKFAILGELDQIQLSYNYKVKRKDGHKIWTLHLMTILEADETGKPLLTMVNMIDITHIKKDDKLDFCVKKKNKDGFYDVVYMESQPNDDESISLSAREIEVLTLISKGEPSKSIAHKLNISIHTVNTHRKKMLEKTGCKNSSELINYGRCKGIALPFI